MKIRNIIIFIFSIFLLNNCKNYEENIDLKEETNTKPLFLDFYPNMEETKFNFLINKYDSLGVLNNKKFNIKIDNDLLDFHIYSSHDNIDLSYSKIIDYKIDINYFDDKTSYNEKVKLKSSVKKLFGFLKNKYSKEENILNSTYFNTKVSITNKNPYYSLFNKNIGLTNYDSFLFRDEDKTIVLSYRINADRHYSLPWFSFIDQAFNKKKSNKTFKLIVTNNLNQIEDDLDITNNDSLLYEENLSDYLFALNVNIKYYGNDVFDKMLKDIIIEKSKIEKNINIKKREEEKLNQKLINNLNKL